MVVNRDDGERFTDTVVREPPDCSGCQAHCHAAADDGWMVAKEGGRFILAIGHHACAKR